MIDSHAHIYAEQFTDDLSVVIARAKEVGLEKIILPNIDEDSVSGLNTLVQEYPGFFYKTIGLHPCSVKPNYKVVLENLKIELNKDDSIAIGEIGVDLFWDKTTKDIQIDAFLIQCRWAIAMDLPIIIHSRESIDLIIGLLEDNFAGKIRGVFHCFTGTQNQASRIIDLGMKLGIGGVVTFKNTNLREELKGIDIQHLLIETDSPYLAPTPYRGKRNESSYIIEVVKTLASVYDTTIETVISHTTENTLKLFNI